MGEKAVAQTYHVTGRTPLLRAVEENDTPAIISLLNAGADPNTTRDQFGETLLHLAVWRSNLTAVNALLRAGADPTQTDDCGSTPLHGATEERIVTALLKAGADPTQTDNWGSTPLHGAKGERIITVLLKAGVDPNTQDGEGDTPLHFAADNNLLPAVRTLMDTGANPNVQNHNLETPLHLAAGLEHSAIVAVLLKGGADPNKQNEEGDTPFSERMKEHQARRWLSRRGENLERQWELARPKMVAQMRRDGKLYQNLLAAEERSQVVFDQARARGLKYDQAMELVYEEIEMPDEETMPVLGEPEIFS